MSRIHSAKGFTLVELLVVTLIIMLLAGLTLSALAGALEEARVQRTHSQITKIHQVIMAKYESYRTRRVNVPYSGTTTNTAQNRLDALRALIRAELPDRVTDVETFSSTAPGYYYSRPMFQRCQAIKNATGQDWSVQYQGAEALYLILSMPQEDGTVPIEFFKQHEIGDLDGDGMKEILDAWGNPIRFLRWPAGFVSPLQPVNDSNYSAVDPFDPYYSRTPPPTGIPYVLVPLIISAGPDGLFDIYFDNSNQPPNPQPPVVYASLSPPNDPFGFFNTMVGIRAGGYIDEAQDGDTARNDSDNIHNHLIDGSR